MTNQHEDVIQHYGVKGMRWGVRNSSKQSVTQTRYQKSPNRLSDAELNKRVKRMETEQKYNKLNQRQLGKGEALAQQILTKFGEKAVTSVALGTSFYLAKKVVGKVFNEGIANEINQQFKPKK